MENKGVGQIISALLRQMRKVAVWNCSISIKKTLFLTTDSVDFTENILYSFAAIRLMPYILCTSFFDTFDSIKSIFV